MYGDRIHYDRIMIDMLQIVWTEETVFRWTIVWGFLTGGYVSVDDILGCCDKSYCVGDCCTWKTVRLVYYREGNVVTGRLLRLLYIGLLWWGKLC